LIFKSLTLIILFGLIFNCLQLEISNLLQLNKAGFTKCLWHYERTASLHKITGVNKVYCFGCGKVADSVDVVMAINNCTLPEAIKIILK
jgi:DNA primase